MAKTMELHLADFDDGILEKVNIARKPMLQQDQSDALESWVDDQLFFGFDGTLNELANQLVDEAGDIDTGYTALDRMGFITTGLIDLVDAVRNGWFTEPKLMTSQKRNKYNL